MILTKAEDIKKRWIESTEELYKRDHNDPDNHDGVITHLEPDILECEVKWYSSSVYSCHLFLISSASGRSIPFLSFIEPIFAWNVPLVSLAFLKRSLVLPILSFFAISLRCSLMKALYSESYILFHCCFICIMQLSYHFDFIFPLLSKILSDLMQYFLECVLMFLFTWHDNVMW